MKKTFKVEIEASQSDWHELKDYRRRIENAVHGIATRYDMHLLVDVAEESEA